MKPSLTASALPLLLSACALNPDADEPIVVYGDCDVRVLHTAPLNGAGDVYHRDAISFTLSSPDPTAKVLADVSGTQTVSADGLTVTFTPDVPLEPDTTHVMALDYCYAQPEIRFTTSSLGTPLDADLDLLGTSWVVDPVSGSYLQGSGFAAIMASIFEREIVAQVVDIDGALLTVRLGVADPSGTVQDECFRTVDVTAVDLSREPLLAFDSSRMNVAAFNGSFTFHDIALTGTISTNGALFGGIEYTMMVDVADLVSVMKIADPDSLCEMASDLGSMCETCPDGGSDTCIAVEARGISGYRAGLDLSVVEETNAVEGCP